MSKMGTYGCFEIRGNPKKSLRAVHDILITQQKLSLIIWNDDVDGGSNNGGG